ncbi:Odorant receptor 94a, partial [Pseudolycoriella hygida]
HTLVLLESFHIYSLVTIGGQLDIISQRFRDIGRKYYSDETDAIWEEKTNTIFLDNIKVFEVISGLIDQIESLFNIQFFYQFICSAVIFCVTAFKIITMNITEDLVSFTFYLSFSATMMNEIFLPCYFGNEVTLKREQLSFAIYSSEWFNLPQPFKKNMILFLEGLKRVRILKSGKIFTLSLFSFLTVINRSYSLFAVLRNFIK